MAEEVHTFLLVNGLNLAVMAVFKAGCFRIVRIDASLEETLEEEVWEVEID